MSGRRVFGHNHTQRCLVQMIICRQRSIILVQHNGNNHRRLVPLHCFSSQRRVQEDIRGTIPYLGQGVAVGQHAEVRRPWPFIQIFVRLSCLSKNKITQYSCTCEKVERRFNAQQIEQFGDLVQDQNILHRPPKTWHDAMTEMPHLQALQNSGLIQFFHEDEQPPALLDRDDNDDSDHTMRLKPLVHGIFVSSLFSSIFGSLSPGCVYMNQTLQFTNPVFAEDLILGRIEIQKIRKWRRGGVVLQCKTIASIGYDESTDTFTKDAVTGIANVWLPSGYPISTTS